MKIKTIGDAIRIINNMKAGEVIKYTNTNKPRTNYTIVKESYGCKLPVVYKAQRGRAWGQKCVTTESAAKRMYLDRKFIT